MVSSHHNFDVHDSSRNGRSKYIALMLDAVNENALDPVLNTVRIFHCDVIDRSAITPCYRKSLHFCRQARVDFQSVQRRFDTKDSLADTQESPCCRTRQPAVLPSPKLAASFPAII